MAIVIHRNRMLEHLTSKAGMKVSALYMKGENNYAEDQAFLSVQKDRLKISIKDHNGRKAFDSIKIVNEESIILANILADYSKFICQNGTIEIYTKLPNNFLLNYLVWKRENPQG